MPCVFEPTHQNDPMTKPLPANSGELPDWGSMTKKQKGEAAEELMENFYKSIGYTFLGKGVGQGLDGVYLTPEGQPLVDEVKFNTSQLNKKTADGEQGSEQWIYNGRICKAVGTEAAKVFLNKITELGLNFTITRVTPDGRAIVEHRKYWLH